ncbi:MAG: lasso peptide biosynthesis B2 protein [Anaerolineales bacterium]|nr:lasso peptide biosynthesis B2 protein [Anaerolineales bacterium]
MWKSLRHRWSLARGLSPSDWAALTEAWRALVLFYFLIRWRGYADLTRMDDSEFRSGDDDLLTARRLYQLTGWAARLHLLPMTCLVQSLALRRMLTRRGIASRLKIGAARGPLGFRAHAWLEVGGDPLGEPRDAGGFFRVFGKGRCRSHGHSR